MEYARGVDRLLWDLEKRPMPDAEAVKAVIVANASGDGGDALDIGGALVLLHAMRLELDCLEADVFDAARASGLRNESLAAVMDLPDAAAVQDWEHWLNTRRELPRAPTPGPSQDIRGPSRDIPGPSHDAAARAGRRASQAADRAAVAARRREQLRPDARPASTGRRTEAERAAAYASEARVQANEARVQANDAAERVALGLLRAASALDRCAARCQEWDSTAGGDAQLRQRAEEYNDAAQRYRQMAAKYRDIGRRI